MNPIENFAKASQIMSGLLGQLTAEDLHRATPCKGWTVADLGNHVVDNAYFFAGAAGSTASADPEPFTASGACSRYQAAAEAVLSAYEGEGMLEQDLETPFGTFPGAMVLSVAFADQLTHCWDLARATGQQAHADDELVDDALSAWRTFIQEDYRSGEMFGLAQPALPNSSKLDNLAAFTGRQV